jgi:hypothetical protein
LFQGEYQCPLGSSAGFIFAITASTIDAATSEKGRSDYTAEQREKILKDARELCKKDMAPVACLPDRLHETDGLASVKL